MENTKKRCECGVTAGIVDAVYWMGLGIWLGSLIALAVAAAITFKTARAAGPVLLQPEYNIPEAAGQGGNILAGLVVGNVIKGLTVVQVVCAVLVWAAIALQGWTRREVLRTHKWGNRLRVGLLVAPLLALALSVGFVMPRMWEQRTVMYNPEMSQEVRQEARQKFELLHRVSERSVGLGAMCLIFAGLVSGVVLAPRTAREKVDGRE